MQKIFVLIALAALVACAEPRVVANGEAPVVFDKTAAPAATAIGPVRIAETLSGAGPDTAPASLENLSEGTTVSIDLTLPTGVLPNVRRGDNWQMLDAACAFGPVAGLDEISLPTGSNHLLLSVHPGSPEIHAANFVSCDYTAAPPTGTESADQPEISVRVRGCFYVHESAIPTARQLVLHPRVAEACDL